jgi:hypothetical protein
VAGIDDVHAETIFQQEVGKQGAGDALAYDEKVDLAG